MEFWKGSFVAIVAAVVWATYPVVFVGQSQGRSDSEADSPSFT